MKGTHVYGNDDDISDDKKKYVVKVFFKIYINQLHFRAKKKQGLYHNPVQEFMTAIRNCLTLTFQKSQKDILGNVKNNCSSDALDY